MVYYLRRGEIIMYGTFNKPHLKIRGARLIKLEFYISFTQCIL